MLSMKSCVFPQGLCEWDVRGSGVWDLGEELRITWIAESDLGVRHKRGNH